MALITMPTKVLWATVPKLQLVRGGVSLRSRYTGKRQTVSFPFAVWMFEGEHVKVEGLSAGEWRAFLVSLEGDQNTFQLPVPGVDTPLSNYAGTPITTTAAAAARAKSIAVLGTANAKAVEKGDYLTVNGELKVATAPCTLNGSGAGTIQFEPGLRQVLASGSAVKLNNPYCTMSAADTEQAQWALERPVRHGFTLKAVEAF